MKLRNLMEEYYDSIKPDYKGMKTEYSDVFVNPSTKDILEVMNSTDHKWCRFIIDIKNKKLYIFDNKLIHYFVAKKIGVKYNLTGHKKAMFGVGTFNKGKLNTENKDIKKVINDNVWLQRYFV